MQKTQQQTNMKKIIPASVYVIYLYIVREADEIIEVSACACRKVRCYVDSIIVFHIILYYNIISYIVSYIIDATSSSRRLVASRACACKLFFIY